MNFDTSLSLELVLTILAILGAIWRLEHKFDRRMSEQRQEFKTDNAAMRSEIKADNASMRSELKADYEAMRSEIKADNATMRNELKADYEAMRSEIKADNIRLADKIDDCNQRLARLEGIILAREDMVGAIAESTQ